MKRTMFVRSPILWLTAATTVTACDLIQAPRVDVAAEEAKIRAISAQWLEADRRQDAAAVAPLFAEDGRLLWADTDTVVGRAAIEEQIAGGFARNPRQQVSWSAERVEVAASGDLAIEIGSFTNTQRGLDGMGPDERGRYATLYRKIDGDWRILADVGAPSPLDAAASTPLAEAALTTRIAALESAFNARDAAAISALFSPQGDAIIGDGARTSGREALRELQISFFAELPPACRLDIEVTSTRLLAVDLAMLEADGTFAECGGSVMEDRGTYLWEHRDGEWTIAALRVLPAEAR